MFRLFKKKKHYQIDAVFKKLQGVSEYPGIFLINTTTGETLTNPNAEDNLFLPAEADAYVRHLMNETIGKKELNISLTEKAVRGIKLAVEMQKQYASNSKGRLHPVKDR
jgi:hypothetical protein